MMSASDFSALMEAVIFWLFLTPVGWAIIILLVISIIIGICKMFGKLGHVVTHPSEYKAIPEKEKRRQLLDALADSERLKL